MIETRTLLAIALAVPLGMLLACLWPRALNRMPSFLALAPMPAACVPVASLLMISYLNIRFKSPSPDVRPGPSGAMLLGRCGRCCGSHQVLTLRSICRAGRTRGRFVVCWLMTLTGCLGVFLAADMVGFYFSSCAALARSLRPRHPPRNPPRMACRRDLYRTRAAGRGILAHGFRAAGPGKSPGDSLLIRDRPQQRCRLASARSDTCPVDSRPGHEGGPRTISLLDATGLFGSADAGFLRGAERLQSSKCQHPWNDPVSYPLETALPDWGTALAGRRTFCRAPTAL